MERGDQVRCLRSLILARIHFLWKSYPFPLCKSDHISSCRECLCHVLRPKMDRIKSERRGSQEMDESLKTLLDSEVKTLWPKGWMQSGYVMYLKPVESEN